MPGSVHRTALIPGAVAVIVWAVSASFAQGEPVSAPQTVFFKANTLYHDGAYEDAVGEYRRLIDSGIDGGNLRFNLGNAYFKLGDLGRAIANYERAERFIPADPDLSSNLAYARSLTGVEPCETALWQRVVFPLRGWMSSSALGWLVCGLWTLTFAALIAHRLAPRQPRVLLQVAAGFAALTLITGVSLADQLAVDEWPRQAVVVGVKEVPARFEPAEDGTAHFSLPEGSKVEVTEEREGWLQVSRCDGRRGWVPADALEIL